MLEFIKTKLNNELDINEKQYKKDLDDLEKEYENNKKMLNDKYNNNSDKIKVESKESEERLNKLYKEKMDLIKFKNELNKKINNINSLIEINELVKNTQKNYADNYFNNINIINILTSFSQSENNEIKKLFETTTKDNNKNNLQEEQNIKEKQENIYDYKFEFSSSNLENDFISKKIKHEDLNLDENSKINYKKSKLQSYNLWENKKDGFMLYGNNSKMKQNIYNIDYNNIEGKSESYQEKSENMEKLINKQEIKNIEKEKSKIENKEIEKNILNILASKAIDNAYCSTETENSFIVFNSILKLFSFLIYASIQKNNFVLKECSIIVFNISQNKIDKILQNAHSSYISSFQYFFDLYNKQELIMSLSYLDRNLKIWNFISWNCIINIKNESLYSNGFIYSACIFNKENINYFAVSNYVKNKNSVGPINIYSFKENFYRVIQTINNSNFNTLLIKSDIINSIFYIIASGKGNIRAYNFKKNELYNKYEDNISDINIFSFIIFSQNQQVNIIGSCDDQYIRIWDFNSSVLLNKIRIESIKLRGISLFNDNYLLVACGDNSIKIVELKNNSIIKILNGHKEKVCNVKTFASHHLKKILFSHGYDDKIIIWKIQD